MSRAQEIQSGVDEVLAAIAAAAETSGRPASAVTLVAVTKTWPISDVEHVAAAGILDVGENRHQDAKEKAAALSAASSSGTLPDLSLALRWHFLGQLQTNKAKAVAAYASVVHSVDRVDLLGPLSRGAEGASRELELLLQLSLDGDTSRGGCVADDLGPLADAVAQTPGLRLGGLMTVAPLDWEPRRAFAEARLALEALQRSHPGAVTLSAGMSGDFVQAVEEGSTMVRVGSAIFGGRTPAVG